MGPRQPHVGHGRRHWQTRTLGVQPSHPSLPTASQLITRIQGAGCSSLPGSDIQQAVQPLLPTPETSLSPLPAHGMGRCQSPDSVPAHTNCISIMSILHQSMWSALCHHWDSSGAHFEHRELSSLIKMHIQMI